MKVEVLQETKVCVSLFEDVKGGPLWFHYDCRCAGEAELIARETRREVERIEATLRASGRRDVLRCEECGGHMVNQCWKCGNEAARRKHEKLPFPNGRARGRGVRPTGATRRSRVEWQASPVGAGGAKGGSDG